MTIWAPGKSKFWLSDKFLKNWSPKVEVQEDESGKKTNKETNQKPKTKKQQQQNQKQSNRQKL